MRRNIFTLFAALTITLTANAMGYEEARNEALFLTDKMAYELGLNDMQREAVYEINLDYFLNVNGYADVEGAYWARRNADLRYVLADYQYRSFINAAYFYRPLYWDRGVWRFHIYSRYSNRYHYYYGRPHAWHSYRGGYARGPRSHYAGRDFHHVPDPGHGPGHGGHRPGHGGHHPGHGPGHGGGHNSNYGGHGGHGGHGGGHGGHGGHGSRRR